MALRRLRRFAATCLAAYCLIVAAGGAWAAGADSRQDVYVHDEAGIITPQIKEQLHSQALWLYEKTGSAQIGIVTVPSLDGKVLEEVSIAKFRELGLGGKDRNDGVLLFYAKDEKRIRLEIGYGMEGRLPDAKSGAILDQYFVPNRDHGQLDLAFLQTQTALIREMAAEFGIDASSIGTAEMPAPHYGSGQTNFWNSLPWYVKLVGGAFILVLFILDFKFTGGAVTFAILSMVSRGRGSSGDGGRGGWGGRGGGGSAGGGGASR